MKLIASMIFSFAVMFSMASCQTKGSACNVLRKPPEMASPTKTAIFKDKPFLTWFGQVQTDGKNYGCW